MIDPNQLNKSIWALGELLIDPQKLFVLWAVKVRFCVSLDDFRNHYGLDFPISKLVDELRQDGFLRQSAGELVLTETGEQAVACLGDNEFSSHAASQQVHQEEITPYRPRRDNENLEDYFEQSLYPGRLHSLPDHQSNGADDIELGVTALMIYLGLADAGSPPEPIHGEIIQIARDFTDSRPPAERLKSLAQLVLAYGCRWRRETESGDLRWDEVWPNALKELTVVAFNFVVHAMNVLSGSVRDFAGPERDDQKGYAALIAWTFITKLPDTNGPKFEKYQSLGEWDPNKGNLYGWLQRAIQGDTEQQGRFQANWFRNGLLFPLLKSEVFLDIRPVAFRRCLHCLNESKDRHSAESEYSQDPCSEKHTYTPNSFFIFQKDLLIVPGVYQGREFWHCATCDGYYDNNLTGCPHCGYPRPQRQRTTTLSVRKEWASAPSLSKEYLDAVEREVKQ